MNDKRLYEHGQSPTDRAVSTTAGEVTDTTQALRDLFSEVEAERLSPLFNRLVTAARAELAALRAENAAQAQQIAALREATKLAADMIGETDDHVLAAMARSTAIVAVEALSYVPPSSMRLVPLDRLRKLADGWHGTDGIEIELCPVCASSRKRGHAPDCWLAAIAGKETT